MGIGTFIGWSFWVFLILTFYAKVRYEHFKSYKLPKTYDTKLDEYNIAWKEDRKHWWDTFTIVFGALAAYCFITYMIFI